jgi:glycosyltransferase involved in cell wall biosynthesis
MQSPRLNKTPFVSVLMPVYGMEPHLDEAIASILGQSHRRLELVIVAGGDVSHTRECIRKCADPRVRLVVQKGTGLPDALNVGLEHCSAELVFRMDADDVAMPNRLETQLKKFRQLGQPDVLGGNAEFISMEGKPLGRGSCPLDHETILRWLERDGGTPILHPTVLYKRSRVLRHGGYDPTFPCCEDFDLWLRMSRDCRLANIPDVLLSHRVKRPREMGRICLERPPCNPHDDMSGPWFFFLARQRHRLEKEGASHLWNDARARSRALALLWPRVIQCGVPECVVANRTLATARAEVKSPGRRAKGVVRAARLCASHPVATLRYLITRQYPSPPYLTAKELMSATP